MLVIKITSEPLEDNTQLTHHLNRDLIIIRRDIKQKKFLFWSKKVIYNIFLDTKADRADGLYEYLVLAKNLELPAVIHWLQGYRTATEHQQK